MAAVHCTFHNPVANNNRKWATAPQKSLIWYYGRIMCPKVRQGQSDRHGSPCLGGVASKPVLQIPLPKYLSAPWSLMWQGESFHSSPPRTMIQRGYAAIPFSHTKSPKRGRVKWRRNPCRIGVRDAGRSETAEQPLPQQALHNAEE